MAYRKIENLIFEKKRKNDEQLLAAVNEFASVQNVDAKTAVKNFLLDNLPAEIAAMRQRKNAPSVKM